MSDNKYKIFRNFMVNELGISREDIKEWTMQAVKETVEKELRGIEISKLVTATAVQIINSNRYLYGFDKDVIAQAVYEIIKNKIVIDIKEL